MEIGFYLCPTTGLAKGLLENTKATDPTVFARRNIGYRNRMGKRIEIHNDTQAILLFSQKRQAWEDKTTSVTAMYNALLYGKISGYDIYFCWSNRKYFYKDEHVQILGKVKNINIDKVDVYVEDARINATRLEQFEKGYYRVHTSNKILFTRRITLKSNKYKDIYTYYTKLAKFAGTIAQECSPLYFLSKNYNRINPLQNNSVLSDYLQGTYKPNNDTIKMVLPFDFNQSQVKAIDKALKNNISVIEGPPGTGKTQTILNLIASIICDGKNCAVVSNNNTAINNIYEKLEQEHLAFIAACLGSKANVQEFFQKELNTDSTGFPELKKQAPTSNDQKKIDTLGHLIKKFQDIEVETYLLEYQLIETQNEKNHYDDLSDDAIWLNQKFSSGHYISLITRLQERRRLRFYEKWMLNFKFGIRIDSVDIHSLLQNAEKLYYRTRIAELSKKIASNKELLKKHNQQQASQEFKLLNRRVLDKYIQKHFPKANHTFSAESYKKNYPNFLLRYPVVLSTSQSLLNNAPNNFTFHYLIIDEASQGDLLSSMLAISCAKNLVVVGDSRQLQQIDEDRLFNHSDRLAKEYDVPESYRYASNSILRSVKTSIPNVPTTLLREHYRCAPDIIQFCNKMFYNGELVAMTKNTGQHIEIVKTIAGNHARKNPNGSGLYSQREIEEVGRILNSSACDNIGIISPFRYQSNLIAQKYESQRIEADTIHKFQGRQKEEIILSFVINSLDLNPDSEHTENRLSNFVTNEKLLNVAISRGEKKVTAIVADKIYHSSGNIIHDFIKYAEYLYGSQTTRESTITSVFDLLYSEHTQRLISKYKERPNHYKSELLMCDLIHEVLNDYGYIGYSMHTRLASLVNLPDTFSNEERRYILHPWTHVDFLFYNKVSKEKLFVLEVDGIKYHEQDNKQTEHDKIKDRVLTLNNIQIHRFKTNESDEKQRLTMILREFLH